MKLYRAYSIIQSSRLLSGQNQENFVKVDWICYLRDEPLVPFYNLIQDYSKLPETGKTKLWTERRANYLLSESEVKELKEYVEQQYSFSVEVEGVSIPIMAKNLVKFNEKDITGTIILRDRNEPFPLSVNIVGMVAGHRDFVDISTVEELLTEIDRRNSF